MKINLFIITFLLFIISQVLAQQPSSCTHLSDWDNSMMESIRIKKVPDYSRNIEMPIVMHRISNRNHQQMMGQIDFLNMFFSNNELPVTFALCEFIDYDTILDLSVAELSEFAEINNVPNAINIYYPKDLGGSSGISVTSSVSANWIGIAQLDPSIVVHEVGHYFGLFHTHNTFWGAELVDGSNCETAGDRFCDTPADPNLSGEVDNMCRYIGNETDANGETYHPDTSNLMSYSHAFCRTTFSEEQKLFMLSTIEALYSDYSCGTTSTIQYELTEKLNLYPNPSTGIIRMNEINAQFTSGYDIEIYHPSGRKIFSIKNFQNLQFDLSKLPRGIYILKFHREENIAIGQIILH